MKTGLSIKQIWFNPQIGKFFFRLQAWKEFERLIDLVNGREIEANMNELSDAIEDFYQGDLNEFEEDCYNMSADDILDQMGVEII